jgi:hypothetical protein
MGISIHPLNCFSAVKAADRAMSSGRYVTLMGCPTFQGQGDVKDRPWATYSTPSTVNVASGAQDRDRLGVFRCSAGELSQAWRPVTVPIAVGAPLYSATPMRAGPAITVVISSAISHAGQSAEDHADGGRSLSHPTKQLAGAFTRVGMEWELSRGVLRAAVLHHARVVGDGYQPGVIMGGVFRWAG